MMVPGMWHGKEVPAKGNVVGYNHELHNCTDSATPQANIFSFTPMFISFGSTIVRKIPFTSRHAPRLATVALLALLLLILVRRGSFILSSIKIGN